MNESKRRRKVKHRLDIQEDGSGNLLSESSGIFFCFFFFEGWKIVDTFDTHISGQDGNTGFFCV